MLVRIILLRLSTPSFCFFNHNHTILAFFFPLLIVIPNDPSLLTTNAFTNRIIAPVSGSIACLPVYDPSNADVACCNKAELLCIGTTYEYPCFSNALAYIFHLVDTLPIVTSLLAVRGRRRPPIRFHVKVNGSITTF